MNSNGHIPAVENDDVEWIDLKEASELTGYHPDHIKRLLRRELVRGRKRGGWWVDKESLLLYMAMVEKLGTSRFGPGGKERVQEELERGK